MITPLAISLKKIEYIYNFVSLQIQTIGMNGTTLFLLTEWQEKAIDSMDYYVDCKSIMGLSPQ